jgi:hypothetical protein
MAADSLNQVSNNVSVSLVKIMISLPNEMGLSITRPQITNLATLTKILQFHWGGKLF